MGFGVEAFKGQKYDKLKKEQLKSGLLFNDPEFLPSQKSLFYSRTDGEIEWKRPTELCKVPKLLVSGAACDDLVEGDLGNRWFIVACSSLSTRKQLFNKVVHDVQDFGLSYTGMFRFQFWLYGKWTEVVVDDLLPTRHGKLVFCHSKSKNEFWSALLEKAYAKLFGDYESLYDGCSIDALVDFTGGVAEKYDIRVEDGQNESECLSMYKQLEEALEMSALVVAEVKEKKSAAPTISDESRRTNDLPEGTDVLVLDSESTKNSPPQTQGGNTDSDSPSRVPKTGYFRSNSIVRDGYMMDCGLLKSHGYIVREVKTVSRTKGEQIHLVRLQSPWQTGEWMGRWSNVSAEMKGLSAQEKTKLGLGFETESEFWMPMSDFLANYTNIDICHFINTSVISVRRAYVEEQMLGSWVTGGISADNRAGGSIEHPTFLLNPQFLMVTSSPSQDWFVMISLEQNDKTLERMGDRNKKNLCIGFTIMKVAVNRKFRLHRPIDVVASSEFVTERSVFYKTPLSMGCYVIVPCTKEPRLSGEFLLRIYSSSTMNAKELLKDQPSKPRLVCISSPTLAVQVTVLKAEGLQAAKAAAIINPFCVVKCEGETARTPVIKDTDSPEWNTSCIFYKKDTDKNPIRIQVFTQQTIIDQLLGEAVLTDLGDSTGKPLEVSLFQKSNKKDVPDIQLPGKVFLHVCSSDNMSEF